MDLLAREIPNTAIVSTAVPVLLDYQIKWIADKSEFKVFEKSRRTGITWAEAADNVIIASCSRDAGGMNVYYISYNQDMALEYIQAAAMWARAYSQLSSEIEESFWSDENANATEAERAADRNIKTYTIKFPKSGFRIVALSSRPANLRGKQGVVVIDEAAFCDQLDELLKAAMALTIWGGVVRVISTHNGDANAFNELIGNIRAGKQAGSVHRITFREAVAQGLFRRVCGRLKKLWSAASEADWVNKIYALYAVSHAEELDVIPANGSGNALSRAQLSAIMKPAPVLRFVGEPDLAWKPELERIQRSNDAIREIERVLKALDSAKRHRLGGDIARVADLSDFWVTAEVNGHQECVLVVELRMMPFDVQRRILFWLYEHLPRRSGMALDGRGLGMQMAEEARQKFGESVHCVMASESWYRDHMPPFITAITGGETTIPNDDEIIDDHMMVRKLKGVYRLAEGKNKGASGERHGDSAIAHVMALYAARNITACDIEVAAAGAREQFDMHGNPVSGRDYERAAEEGVIEIDLDFGGYV